MTDLPLKSADKIPEAGPPDLLASALSSKLAESAILTSHLPKMGLSHVETDSRSVLTAALDGVGGAISANLTGIAQMAGYKPKSDAQIADAMKNHLSLTQSGDVVTSLVAGAVKTAAFIGTHPKEFLTGLHDSGSQFIHKLQTGTRNDKAEALGGAAVFVGSLLLPAAGGLSKIGTESDALNLAGRAGSEVAGASNNIGAYLESARTSTASAATEAEARMASAEANKLAAGAMGRTVEHLAEGSTPAAAAESRLAQVLEHPGSSLSSPLSGDALKPIIGTPGESLTSEASLAKKLLSLSSAGPEPIIGTASRPGLSLANRLDGLKPPAPAAPSFLTESGAPRISIPLAKVEPVHLPIKPLSVEPVGSVGPVEPVRPVEPVEPVKPVQALPPHVETFRAEPPQVGIEQQPPHVGMEPPHVKPQVGIEQPHVQAHTHLDSPLVHQPVGDVETQPAVNHQHPIASDVETQPAGHHRHPTASDVETQPVVHHQQPIASDVETQPAVHHQHPIAIDVETQPSVNHQQPIASDVETQPAVHHQQPIASDVETQPAVHHQQPIASDVETQPAVHHQQPIASDVETQPAVHHQQPIASDISPAPHTNVSAGLPVSETANPIIEGPHPLPQAPAAGIVEQSNLPAAARPVAEVPARDPLKALVGAQFEPPAVDPTVAAVAKASDRLGTFTAAAGEKGLLTPELERTLTTLDRKLTTIGQGENAVLTQASLTALKENLALVETAVAGSSEEMLGAQFADLKLAVENLSQGQLSSGVVQPRLVPTEAKVAPVTQPFAPSTTPVFERAAAAPILDIPAVTPIADRAFAASESLKDLTSLAAEKGLNLPLEAQSSFRALDSQLQTIARETDAPISVAVRNEIADNFKIAEDALAGAEKDPLVAKRLEDLRASINRLAPSSTTTLVPVSEAPTVIAERAGEAFKSFAQAVQSRSFKLSPEAEQSLANINAHIEALAGDSAVPLTAAGSKQLAQDVAVVKESLLAKGADPELTRQFGALTKSVNNASAAVAERQYISQLRTAMTSIESQSTELSRGLRTLAQKFEPIPDMTVGDRNIATSISSKLEILEPKLSQAAITQTPVTTAREISQVVRELDRPEYRSFFASNPEAATAFSEIRTADAAITGSAAHIEESEAGLGGLRRAEVFQQNADAMASLTQDLKLRLPASEARQPVAQALSNIERDLGTISSSGDSQAVLAIVNTSIEQIERAGAPEIAQALRPALKDLEESGVAVTRLDRGSAATASVNGVEAKAVSVTENVGLGQAASGRATVASQAGDSLENLSNLTRERGMTLAPQVQGILESLDSQLKTIARSPEARISAAVRNEISNNFKVAEDGLVRPGADPIVNQQFAQLKVAINKLSTSETLPLVPVSESPVLLATRASESLETFTQSAAARGLKMTPEAEQSLASVNEHINSVVGEGEVAAPLTPQSSQQLAHDLSVVEKSIATSGADPVLTQQFGALKASLNDVSSALVEREHIGVVQSSMNVLDAQSTELANSMRTLSERLENSSAMTEADRAVASKVVNRLNGVESILGQGALTDAPVATSSEVSQIVKELERPEYGKFFVNDPEAAAAFEEVKASSAAVAGTTSKIETAEVGLGGLRRAQMFQENVDNLATLSRDLRTSLPAAEASQPVVTALTNIERDLSLIKSGSNTEAVLRDVRTSMQAIENAGANDIASSLKPSLSKLEDTSTAIERSSRLVQSLTDLSGGSSELETQTAGLSQKFADEAATAPSTTSVLPMQSQVSDQLQLISRQARLIDAGENGAAAITKIKDAFSKVEELTAGSTLSTEQEATLMGIKNTIEKVDRASVEATGLQRFESNASKITEQSQRVEALTDRISQTVSPASGVARDLELDTKLNNIRQAAFEVKEAQTLDQQASAVNRLNAAVQEPELQAALKGNRAALGSLNDLRTGAAELHESVSYRALERSQVVSAAEAENAATVARTLEARIQNDAALATTPSVQRAAFEYRTAAESFAQASDKNLVAVEMERKLDALQTQISTVSPNNALLQGEEMAALRRAQASVSQSTADRQLLTRSLIDRRLPAVEGSFDQLSRANNSTLQRAIMNDISEQIQRMRYLEGTTGDGAERLAQAQIQLLRAQNDMEVAAYRSNLVKLAAAGDRTATDKLFVSGLTSDGFKTNSMAASAGPTARLIEEMAKHYTSLQGLYGKSSLLVRSLTANDPLFVNNAGALSSAMRYAPYALIGGGATSFAAGYLNKMQEANPPSSSASNSALDRSPTADGQVIGRTALEPKGFSPNGQSLARSAYAQDLANQALPRPAALTGAVPTPNIDTVYGSADTASIVAPYRPSIAQAGPFIVYNNDVNRDAELYRLQYSGTLYGLAKAAEEPVEPELRVPLSMAQTLHIGPGGRPFGSKRLEKPATSQFAITASTMYSPKILGQVGRPDVLSSRYGGSPFAGIAGGSRSNDVSGLRVNSLSEADGDEAAAGAGTGHLKHVERTESKGVDSGVAHSGAASANTAVSNNGHDDENNAVDPDPIATAAGPDGTTPASPSTLAGSRVPPVKVAGQTSVAAGGAASGSGLSPATPAAVSTASPSDNGAKPLIATPPRKRQPQDAISA